MSSKNIICISCPKGCRMEVESDQGHISNITGYSCPVGKKYACKEFKNPTRVLPTTVRVSNGERPLVSVKTADPIPKDKIIKVMREIAGIEVEAPVEIGQVIIKDILNTGVNLVTTSVVDRV